MFIKFSWIRLRCWVWSDTCRAVTQERKIKGSSSVFPHVVTSLVDFSKCSTWSATVHNSE